MDRVYNVRNPPSPLPGEPSRDTAVGDGCADDTKAIQDGLNALSRYVPSVPCAFGNGLRKSPPHFSTLYLPAGIYRIRGRLRIPRSQNFRIVGDGERGGGFDTEVPRGTLIQQDLSDEPILVFEVADTHSWAIDGIGFTWLNPQGPPAGWTPPTDNAKQIMPGATSPGACGILFSGERTTPAVERTDFYHGRITNCGFTDGWRGISFDDTFTDGIQSVWDIHMDGLTMFNMVGAALSLVVPAGGIGMPVNSFRNAFIDNPRRVNVEPRIQIAQQGAFLFENVTMEHSSTGVVSCIDCQMTMRNVSVEHAQIRRAFGILFYFGGGQYTVDGLGIDGWMDGFEPGPTPAQDKRGFCTVINADGRYPDPSLGLAAGVPTTVVLSNFRASPVLPTAPNPDVGGFMALNEPVALLAGPTNTEYHVLNSPSMPVFNQDRRAVWNSGPARSQFGTYREFFAFTDAFTAPDSPMSAVVRMPEAKYVGPVNVGQVGARTARRVRVSFGAAPPSRPRVRPGDTVRIGPPAALQLGLIVTGSVLVNDAVDVQIFNSTGAPVNVPTEGWTIQAGGGPNSGAEQLIPPMPGGPPPLPF